MRLRCCFGSASGGKSAWRERLPGLGAMGRCPGRAQKHPEVWVHSRSPWISLGSRHGVCIFRVFLRRAALGCRFWSMPCIISIYNNICSMSQLCCQLQGLQRMFAADLARETFSMMLDRLRGWLGGMREHERLRNHEAGRRLRNHEAARTFGFILRDFWSCCRLSLCCQSSASKIWWCWVQGVRQMQARCVS